MTDIHPFVNLYGCFITLIFLCGFYCIMVTKNLIRVLIGLEVLAKGATLVLVVGGVAGRNMALAQSLIITVIVIETVLVPVVAGVILGIFEHKHSLDVGNIRTLQG